MNRLVITMPIAPFSSYSLGKLSTPVLADTLAKKIGGSCCLAINSLSSYQSRDVDGYKKLLEKYSIMPDELWIDNENVKILLEKIYFLIEKGFIFKTEKCILHCDCKKVEICSDYIDSINMIDSCFTEFNGKYYCKSCKSECRFTIEEVLVFDPNLIDEFTLNFYPFFVNKDVKTFDKTIRKNEIIISRLRSTGVKINYENKSYNLDIDFLWEVYLSLFSNYEKVVMCSNHQLYMVMMLEKCFEKSSQTIGIATPYLKSSNLDFEKCLEDRVVALKLYLLFCMRWQKKENVIDLSLLSYLSKMSVEKIQQLYSIVMQKNINNSLIDNINDILTKDFNFQIANNVLKRRRKNV